MSDLQAIADRVDIEALRVEFAGREEIRAGTERLEDDLWDYLVRTSHPGIIQLNGDAASGRAYVLSFGRLRDGDSRLGGLGLGDPRDGGHVEARAHACGPVWWGRLRRGGSGGGVFMVRLLGCRRCPRGR